MMRWTILSIVPLLLVGLSGCVQDAPDASDVPEEPDVQYQDDRNFTVDQPNALPRDPPAPGERTLNATPEWRLGEWWTYEITSFFDGKKEQITRVVAGSEHDNYLVGFPIEEFNNFAMVMHHPAYGDIKKGDLSYDTHDAPFAHLHFPLQVGDTWSTKWQSPNNNIDLEVLSVDHATGEAVINVTQTVQGNVLNGGQTQVNHFGTIVYDAELGEAKKMTFNGYAQVEVLDHGYNYTGPVRVPHAHDLVFFHGRFAGGQPIGQSGGSGGPQGPDEVIEVADFYDRVSFAIIIIDVPGFVANTGTGQGYYSQTAVAPDGTEYTLEMRPDDFAHIKLEFFEHEDPAGQWRLNTVAAGPGQVLFEGIGYHSIDIELPSGCVLPSANALHHVTLCDA